VFGFTTRERNIMFLTLSLRPRAFFHVRRRYADGPASSNAAHPPDLRSIERQEIKDTPQVYDLYRIDDNANEFLMYTFMYREQAEQMLTAFESRGHKQVYFIRSRSPASKP
ncbi:hypothetical protein Vretimale_1041, partial [Volvox reticuliferus]